MTEQSATIESVQLRRDKRNVVVVWAALSIITIVAWQLTPGHADTGTQIGAGLAIAIVVLGMIKGRLIIRWFMEIRHAPRWLQYATDGWLAVLWIALLVIYLY